MSTLPTALPRPLSKPSQNTSERPESTASTSSAKPSSDTPKPLTASTCKKIAKDDPWEPVFDDLPTPPRSPSSMFTRSFPSPKRPNNSFFTPSFSRGKRPYSTSASGTGTAGEGETVALWDQLLQEVDEKRSAPHMRTGGDGSGSGASFLGGPSASSTRPRASLSAPEISAFNSIFDLIFNAVNETSKPVEAMKSSKARARTAVAPEAENDGADPDPDPDPAVLSFTSLRRQSNRMRRTSKTDMILDALKEQIELCPTDIAVLQWTQDNLFAYAPGIPHPEVPPTPAPDSESSLSPEDDSGPPTIPPGAAAAPSTYPHVLSHLMHLFRTTYANPHTSLALFSRAKLLSIPSYVFGCTTPAYNELLYATWAIDRDLKGVEDILREMRANALKMDGKTKAFVEALRKEVGEWLIRAREVEVGNKGAEASGMIVAGDEDPWAVMERVEALVLSVQKGKGKERDKEGKQPKKQGKLEAKRSHWNEEWKSKGERGIGEEDKLSLA
ncbi:hypothetical protein M422DRAFT_27198 [Sphaerobolus stellatus SS14]|nr:hypothetical protein M422DRAFT_27198 [Sphaerobolus stellatus SS14]